MLNEVYNTVEISQFGYMYYLINNMLPRNIKIYKQLIKVTILSNENINAMKSFTVAFNFE